MPGYNQCEFTALTLAMKSFNTLTVNDFSGEVGNWIYHWVGLSQFEYLGPNYYQTMWCVALYYNNSYTSASNWVNICIERWKFKFWIILFGEEIWRRVGLMPF